MLLFNSFEEKFKFRSGDFSYTVNFNPSPTEKALRALIGMYITLDGEDWEVMDCVQSVTYPYSTVTMRLRPIDKSIE